MDMFLWCYMVVSETGWYTTQQLDSPVSPTARYDTAVRTISFQVLLCFLPSR